MKPGERVRIGKPPGAGPWLGDDTEKKVHKIQEGSEGVVRAEQSGELVHVEFDCLKGFLIVCNIVFLEPITPSNKVCVCMTSQLVWGGCLCGAMQVERKKS